MTVKRVQIGVGAGIAEGFFAEGWMEKLPNDDFAYLADRAELKLSIEYSVSKNSAVGVYTEVSNNTFYGERPKSYLYFKMTF